MSGFRAIVTEVGMEPNVLVDLFGICFSVSLFFLAAPVPCIARALAPGTGALALLRGDSPAISSTDKRSVQLVYIGTTTLSEFWWFFNSGCWPWLFSADKPFGWLDAGKWIGDLICGNFVYPLVWSGWWCTMKMGFFSMFVNQPYHDAAAAHKLQNPDFNGGIGRDFTRNMMIFCCAAPLLIANDVAQTSSKCDELMMMMMSKLNDLGIKHGEKHHGRIDWLETRLRRLHHSQGLGFVIFGMVLDRRSLGKLAFAVGSGLITVITWALALSGETVVAASPPGACGLDAAQQLQVNEFATRYAHTLLANATCVTWS